jgi:HEAT repeat protein
MENSGPPQSLDEALLAALAEAEGADSPSEEGAAVDMDRYSQADLPDPIAKIADGGRRAAVLDALARGGNRSLSALIGALRSGDDDVVMYAATALGEARDPAAVPHLIRLLQHPDLNVAQAAIDALGKLRAQSAAAPIEAMLEADPWLRFAAAHALGEIGHPGSVHALMRGTSDPAISELAIEALGKVATVPAATVLAEIICSRADSENFDGCLLALGVALARMADRTGLDNSRPWQKLASPGARSVHARLVSLLVRRDVEPDGAVDQHYLKEAAITVIRSLALPNLYPALVEAAWDVAIAEPLLDAVLFIGPEIRACVVEGLGNQDADVRVFCATAAAAMGIEEGAPACEALLGHAEPRVRVASLRALAALGAERSLPSMARCLVDGVETVSAAAVKALGSMDPDRVTVALLSEPRLAEEQTVLILEVMRNAPCAAQRPFVVDSLADPRPSVRRAAVSVLGADDNAETIDMLEPLLHDRAAEVRAEVISALGRRASRKALALLLDTFERDVDNRDTALRAIGRIGDGLAAQRLVASYPKYDHNTRLAIIDALGAMAAPVAEPFLAEQLRASRPEIRSRAVVAVGQYSTDGAVCRLVHATRDADARVRLAALESLSSFAGRALAVEAFERLCLDPIPAIAALARRCLRKP